MQISIEILYHWRCEVCQKWWTVADIEPNPYIPHLCPHCGKKSRISKIQNGKQQVVEGVEWVLPGGSDR